MTKSIIIVFLFFIFGTLNMFGQSCIGNQGEVYRYNYQNLIFTPYWGNIQNMYDDEHFPDSPTKITLLNDLSLTERNYDFHGSIVKGFIKAPESMDYLFNITGYYQAQLFLSTNEHPENLEQIARTTYTTVGQHNNKPEQTSDIIQLAKDSFYYFEVHHYDINLNEHFQLYWRELNSTEWSTIEDSLLYAYVCDTMHCLEVDATCDDNDSLTINDVVSGSCQCIGEYSSADLCVGNRGKLLILYYDSISGLELQDLYAASNFPNSPSSTELVTSLSVPRNRLEVMDFGTITKGYIRVPTNGTYTFNVTGDERVAFYFTTNDSLELIAESNMTKPHEHNTSASQTSVDLVLSNNEFYYFELHHTSRTGGPTKFGNGTVFWKTPFARDNHWKVVSRLYLYGYNCFTEDMPEGSPCDDNDPLTIQDCFDAEGVCQGKAPTPTCAPQNQISNNVSDSWLSCQESVNPNAVYGNSHWIMYDFGNVYSIKRGHYWNYNVENETGKGAKDVIVDYSTDGVNWTNLGVYEWAESSGFIGDSGDSIPFNNEVAQYVLVTIDETWIPGSCAGFSEVEFELSCAVVGVSCDDLNSQTVNDQFDEYCECHGSNLPDDIVNDCAVDIISLTQSSIPSGSYSATTEVNSNSEVLSDSIVIFTAGEVIKLNPGFNTSIQSIFHAEVLECATPLPMLQLNEISNRR